MDKSQTNVPQKNLTGVLWDHQSRIVSEWVAWWGSTKTWRRWFPAVGIGFYWLGLLALNGFRGDHAVMGGVLLLLCYGGPFTAAALRFLLPLILTGMIYDSQRFYSDYLRGPVHVREPYLFDRFFFGIQTSGGILTPNEWLQLHTHPLLDLSMGFIYLVFFVVFTLFAAYFHFYLPRKGTQKCSSPELRKKSMAMMWAFFWLNIVGFSTYYWYAAAPPWYVSLKGLGPADMSTPANAAGCARFDALLGTHVFSEMYGRSADVFGAIPSLHIAYPFLVVYFSFVFGAARIPAIIFYLWMCFAAVYLNHHYILDIIWGTAYAWAAAVLTLRYFNWKMERIS